MAGAGHAHLVSLLVKYTIEGGNEHSLFDVLRQHAVGPDHGVARGDVAAALGLHPDERAGHRHDQGARDALPRDVRMLAQDIKKGMFVTALYCILNKKTHEMRVASAGHNPMVVWRAASNKIELVNPSGIALGFDKGPVFEQTIREEIVALGKGDRVLLFTDGTVDSHLDRHAGTDSVAVGACSLEVHQ